MTLVCRSLCERYCAFNLGRGSNEAFHPYWAFHLSEACKCSKQLSVTMTFLEINSHHGFNTTLNNSSPDSHKLLTQRRTGPNIFPSDFAMSQETSLTHRGEYRPFLRSVTAFGSTKIGAQILIDQLKINIDTV